MNHQEIADSAALATARACAARGCTCIPEENHRVVAPGVVVVDVLHDPDCPVVAEDTE